MLSCSVASRLLSARRSIVLGITILAGTAIGLGFFAPGGSIVPRVSASEAYPADLNNDNVVNISDLSILISNWNTTNTAADINKDGTINIFDLSALISKWGVVGGGVATGPQAMKAIGLSKPVYASSGTATYANDTNYDTAWSPGTTGWLAFDLSSEPVANRQSIVFAWFVQLDDGYSVDSYNMSCPAWSGRPYLANYTIEVNSAAGGGSAPTSGWQTVATVTNNLNLSGEHRINFAGYNWVRINGNGPNGIEVNVDIADASQGETDGWLFMGDSITNTYASHVTLTDPSSNAIKSFTEQISAGTSAQYRPIQRNVAMSCSGTSGTIDVIDNILDSFHGKYVTINLGTNDGWGGNGDPTGYYNNMQTLVNHVRAKGKIAVVPTLPWPNNTGQWQTGIEAFNAKIQQLYTNNPDVIRGPDLYTLTKDRPGLFNGTGDVHPNSQGGALIRKAWADAMLQNVYGR